MSSKTLVFACWLLAVTLAAISGVDAQEYTWPAYSPNIAYDFNTQFGPLEPPTKVLPGVSGVEGIYANGWWCFVWGANKNPQVTDAAWIPMMERFNKDFAFMTDIMGWPRDVRAQHGYYSTVYLFGSGLSTDNASNTDPGGWMGTTVWNGEPWHCVLASYIPVKAFDPATPDGYQSGAMIHEGIHAIFAPMSGGNQSAWAQESFNVWLQGTMESLRNGSFSGLGGLSAGSQIAPFIPIQCYSGWLQDGSFGGPNAEGVNKAGPNGQICTWRQILGGYQYGEAFPHAMEVILGPKSIPWMWNSTYSGYLLENIGMAPGGIGDAQMRRFIQEYRGRQAFCDFKQWSHAFRQLLHNYWMASVEEEWSPYDVDVDPWIMTCYVATTNSGGTLTPEARTLPGWSGANQIPLTVDPAASSVSVTFNPIGTNMSCQLVYRDTTGVIHYSTPVSSGTCSIPVANVLNNVVVAVVCNTDYIYVDDTTRTTKFGYTLDIGTGITGTADIYTKWWDYNPATYTITASAGANGTINPSGAVVVNNGAVQTFTFAPAPGYKVDKVLLNGLPVGSPTSYTLNPVLSDLALQVTFRDATPPSAPGGLTATPVNGSMVLDWVDNSEPDFASYGVYRSTTNGSGYALIASGVTASSYTDTTAVHGTTYYYVVTALDVEANASSYSNQASAVAIDTVAPAAPTGLVVESAGSSAFLDWADNSEADLASYTVYRSTTSGSGYVAIASGLTSSSYTDSSLVLGTTYYYVVTAKDLSGNQSGYSTQLTPVSKLLAKWDFNDPSLGAANGVTVPSSTTSPTYIWRVAAYDKSGKGNDITTTSGNSAFKWYTNSQEGNFSIKASGTTPSAYTRSDKSGVSAANDVEKFTGTAFTVEALATISGSNIYRTVLGREAQNLSTANPGSTALNLGLDDQNRAWFAYVDVNGKNVDVRSTTTFAADDNVFHHFAASTDGSTVSLYVDGVLVAQTTGAGMAGLGIGNPGTGYRPGAWCIGRALYYGNQNDHWFGYIDSVSITGLALKPGNFVLSNAGADATAPAAPASLAATAGDGSVALDWPDNTEPDLATYTVYRSSISGSGYALIRSGLTTSEYAVPVAPNGKTYYYVVTATDAFGNESNFSIEAAATPIDTTPPAAPTGLSAAASDGSVVLNWSDNTDPDLASYTVYRSTTSGGGYTALAFGLSVSAFVDNSAVNGTTYYYMVRSVDTSANESSNSAQVSATPELAPELATGTVIGSSGSWGNSSNTKDKAFDGNLGTYYDAVSASGDWTGLDLGSPRRLSLIKYCPRPGWASRMVGGVFQGSNTANFSSGVVTLYTVGSTPSEGVLTTQVISDEGTYRYVRYLGPANAYCNVAEVEFYIPATDTTPPSAPGGLAASPENATVQLDWADNSESDLANYSVYRSTTSGSGFASIASGLVASNYVDNTGVNGTTYYYVVTATDFFANESDISTEVSAIPMTPAQSWRLAHFDTIDNTGDAADDADPDLDGIKNMLERAFGGNPNAFDTKVLPKIDETGSLVNISYRKSKAATDLTFTVEEDDLTGTWTAATGSSEVLSDDGTVQVIRFTSPANGATKKFLRLSIGQGEG